MLVLRRTVFSRRSHLPFMLIQWNLYDDYTQLILSKLLTVFQLLETLFSSYLTYIKLSTAIKRNESMAKSLQKALLQQQLLEEDGKRTPRPQDLIRLYDIILQVITKAEKDQCLATDALLKFAKHGVALEFMNLMPFKIWLFFVSL